MDSSNTLVFAPTVTFNDALYCCGGFSYIHLDTSSAGIWQIGRTRKPVFSPADTVYKVGIMTDTTNTYPINMNNSFLVKIDSVVPNFTFSFWHKYQTDLGRDGGVVEFSSDSGATWLNLKSCSGISTFNFYGSGDSIFTGENAFTGNSHGEVLSAFQAINCYFPGTMISSCSWSISFSPGQQLYLRFRFVSDSFSDSLSGWMIDSMKFSTPECLGGSLPEVNNQHPAGLIPNPANDDITITTTFTTPYTITLINMVGQQVYRNTSATPQQTIDVSHLPAGVYEALLQSEAGEKYYEKAAIVH